MAMSSSRAASSAWSSLRCPERPPSPPHRPSPPPPRRSRSSRRTRSRDWSGAAWSSPARRSSPRMSCKWKQRISRLEMTIIHNAPQSGSIFRPSKWCKKITCLARALAFARPRLTFVNQGGLSGRNRLTNEPRVDSAEALLILPMQFQIRFEAVAHQTSQG